MAPEEIRPWLIRTPFIPLRFHLSDNSHYDVMKSEFVMLGRTVLLLGMRRDIDSPYFDEPILLTLGQVTRVIPLVEAMPSVNAPTGGN